MTSHEIFQKITPALVAEIFGFLQRGQQPVYKAAIQGLANQRNLRPVFIERKPPAERYPWLQTALGKKISEGIAAHVLQAWLLGARKQMLCDFLDALEIGHDEDGTVEQVPSSPSKEKLAEAVGLLTSRYQHEEVAVYLHAFRQMDTAADWPPLRELLADDERLRLGQAGTSEVK